MLSGHCAIGQQLLDYLEAGTQLAVDLINTEPAAVRAEQIGTLPAVRAFMHARGQRRRLRVKDVARLQLLRSSLRAVFRAHDAGDAAAHINALLISFPVRPKLVVDAARPAIAFEPEGDDFVAWVAVTAAAGLAFFITQHGVERLGTCIAPDCEDAFYDGTKNKTKRFCSNGCAQAASLRAFRARRR